MFTMPISCQKCGSWEIEAMREGGLYGVMHRIAGRRLYQCCNCHWRGYFAGTARDLSILWILSMVAAIGVISWVVLTY